MKLNQYLLRLISLLSLSGCVLAGEYRFSEPIGEDTFSFHADLVIESYPPGTAYNPAFEASLTEPVLTSKVRLVMNDRTAHVTEIRLFGPETTEYPPALSGKTAGVEAPNLATGATVTASDENEGRPKEAVVDGLLTFTSRWYSEASELPHWLVIDMGEEKELNYIQMVSGYLSQGSAVWNSIIKDFHFEYWKNGDWKKMSLKQPPAREAGALGIKIEGSKGGNLVFLHDNDRAHRFAIGSFKDGELEVVEGFGPENIEEPQKGANVRIGLKKSGGFYHLFCNSRKIAAFDGADLAEEIRGPLAVSLLTLSKDTSFRVVKTGLVDVKSDEDDLLRNLVIKDLQNDIIIPSSFDPFGREVYAVLPSITNEASVELVVSESQKVYINGEQTSALRLNKEQIDQADPIEIRVVSKNGERSYSLDIVPVPPSGRLRLAFADEFEAGELNMKNWVYRRGLRWQSLNTPEAISVKDGNLRIELKVEDGQQKVGGIITKKVHGYGYFETRAKLTDANGWHSAFWLYGLNGYKAEKGSDIPEMNGVYTEIDCFESVTADAFSTNLHHTIHKLKGRDKKHQANVADDFHTFSWLWTPKEVCYYFDGKLIDRRVYLAPTRPQNVWLTCVAHPDAETEGLPKEILFDYFRYYELVEPSDKLPEEAIIVSTKSKGYAEKGSWKTAKEDKAQSYLLEIDTRKTNTKGSSCKWSARLPEKGQYEVFIWNPYIVIDPIINERTFEIRTASGSETARYNPRISGQQWVSLGSYVFDGKATVSLKALDDETYRADAVAFAPRDSN